jgi:pyruvate dehydrogenase E1 component alpha subunit
MMENGKGHGAGAAPEGKSGFSLISNEKLTELYTNLLKCRMAERQAASLAPPSKAPLRRVVRKGNEASRVGVAAGLLPEDSLISLDDDVATGVVTGVPLRSIFASLRAGTGQDHQGLSHSRNGVSPEGDLRARLHGSLGVALTNKTIHSGGVAVLFLPEGGPAWWLDALQVASAHELPIIFVLKENPRGRSKTTPKAKTEDAGKPGSLPRIAVDSNDVVAVYRVAHEAIGRARRGRGPTLIECLPVRLEKNGKAGDAIANMENYLHGKGWKTRKLKQDIVSSFAAELNAALQRK